MLRVGARRRVREHRIEELVLGSQERALVDRSAVKARDPRVSRDWRGVDGGWTAGARARPGPGVGGRVRGGPALREPGIVGARAWGRGLGARDPRALAGGIVVEDCVRRDLSRGHGVQE